MQLKIKFPEDPEVHYRIEANVVKISFYPDSCEIKEERLSHVTKGFSNSTPGESAYWVDEKKALEYLRKIKHYIEEE
jgi:hypothetical protein